MLGAAAMTAQSVAVRDAVFLSSRDWTAIPAMLFAISISALLLALFDRRLAHLMARATPTPATLVAAAALFLCEWLLGAQARSMTAVIRCSLYGLRRVEIAEKAESSTDDHRVEALHALWCKRVISGGDEPAVGTGRRRALRFNQS